MCVFFFNLDSDPIERPWKASFSSVNGGEKHCIRIPIVFRLYLEKIIQILTN
jgi:hypothetical protein